MRNLVQAFDKANVFFDIYGQKLKKNIDNLKRL